MASGTIKLTSGKAWRGEIRWSSTAFIGGNYSTVTVNAYMWKTDGYTTGGNSPTSGKITVDGATYDLLEISSFKDEVRIYSDTFTIYHNEDGTKSVSISLTCKGPSGTSLSGYSLSGSGTATLDKISKVSTVRVNSVNQTLGQPVTFTIEKVSPNFTCTLTYSCGSESGTIADKTSSATVTWTPPLNLARQNPTGTEVTVFLSLTTYDGDTRTGGNTSVLKCAIPETVVPTVSIGIADSKGYFDKYGGYVQNKSTLNVTINTGEAQGSEIASCIVDFDGKSYSGTSFTTTVIKESGNLEMTAIVTDFRGRTATATQTVTVLPYEPPTVTAFSIKRSDNTGKSAPNGDYLCVSYTVAISPLNNKNSATYTLQHRKRGMTDYTSEDLTRLSGAYVVTDSTTVFAADQKSSYDVIFTVKDDFGTTTKSGAGQSISKLWSIFSKGRGFAFGKLAELENALDMGWRIHMNSNKITGLGEPEDNADAATKNYVDTRGYLIEKQISATGDSILAIGGTHILSEPIVGKGITSPSFMYCSLVYGQAFLRLSGSTGYYTMNATSFRVENGNLRIHYANFDLSDDGITMTLNTTKRVTLSSSGMNVENDVPLRFSRVVAMMKG